MADTRVHIVDYGVGNLTSVKNAFTFLGIQSEIVEAPEKLEGATHVLLPGVGSFRAGMEGLARGGWIEPLRRMVREEKKPFLGVCLGMQLLADEGFENGTYAGLGIISGRVEKIPVPDKTYHLPHIGWNDVRTKRSRITKELPQNPDFYFVHSYRFVPKDESVVVGVAEYGVPVVAIIEAENVCGTQFHPEKSQENGMRILRNFAEMS